MAQGGRPLLMQEMPAAPAKQARLASGGRDGFNSRGPSRALTEGNATYRLAVGRRQRVMPGSIVGALANEGGLTSAQIGGIDIRADHTLVELPADLSADQLRSLSRTRIGGELIHLELDNGRSPRSEEGGREGGGVPWPGRRRRIPWRPGWRRRLPWRQQRWRRLPWRQRPSLRRRLLGRWPWRLRPQQRWRAWRPGRRRIPWRPGCRSGWRREPLRRRPQATHRRWLHRRTASSRVLSTN